MKLTIFRKNDKTYCKLMEVIVIQNFPIPKGFEFDGASIPKFFWSFVGHPLESDFLLAACLHDWLYTTHFASKDVADNLFYKTLKENGVGRVKSKLMFLSVKWFGGKGYENRCQCKKNKNKNKNKNNGGAKCLSEQKQEK